VITSEEPDGSRSDFLSYLILTLTSDLFI